MLFAHSHPFRRRAKTKEDIMIFKEFMLTWGMILVGVLFNVFGIYALKAKMNVAGSISFTSVGSVIGYFWTLAKYPSVILGIIAVFAAPLPYAVAVSKMPLSIAYPVSVALNFLVLIPVSICFLGETMSAKQVIAMALLVISIYFLYK